MKNSYAIRMVNISKSFNGGKIKANKNINLNVSNNEIHAIIGENGAGKSTLMSILFGIYEQDTGDIYINENKVHFTSAQDASKAGLGMVHQHFKLIDSYSILDNIILGSEITNIFGVINRKEARKKIEGLVKKYNFNIDINKKISECSVSEQQKTEILKLLYRDSEILIFDEPTAVLNEHEIKTFLQMLLDFKNDGKTIIIITHKFNEIKEVADRATVIRRGEYISDFNIEDKSIQEMAELMVGKKVNIVKNDSNNINDSNVVLEVNDLFLTNNSEAINFKIHSGEIFAIAGVEGNGQIDLVESIIGMKDKKMGLLLNGEDISKKTIKQKYDKGISFVPEDRHKHGLILDLSIKYNAMLSQINKKQFSKYGFINEYSISINASNIVSKFDVRGAENIDICARQLSGGNQQKLIIGREMTKEHNLLILVQPTRGLDLGAIEYIHTKILEEKNKGNAILLISYELDEILCLADKIAVMSNNKIVDVGNREKMSRQYIGELMAGGING